MSIQLKELLKKNDGREFSIEHLNHKINLKIIDGCLTYRYKKEWLKIHIGSISPLYLIKIEEALSDGN